MPGLPLIIIVGGDALALRVCEELCATEGHVVALMWNPDEELKYRVERMGARFIGFPPNDLEQLRAAGVPEAASMMALSHDDRLNLQVALKARDLNPSIRVVLRQFNRQLGRKIEQNLPDCSVVSAENQSAATFAASAIDHAAFYGIQFPDIDGPLVAFAKRTAASLGFGETTTLEAFEGTKALRIVGYAGTDRFCAAVVPRPTDELIIFGQIPELEALSKKREHTVERHSVWDSLGPIGRALSIRRWDPIVRGVAAAALLLLVIFTTYFSFVLHKDPVTAAYFVITTMTTVGYGDVTPPLDKDRWPLVVAMTTMVSGVVLSGIFIALLTATITRAQFVATQGVRQLHERDHIIVCGAGQVGSRVIDYLIALGKEVVVVDQSPDTTLIERARDRELILLTGDAAGEAVLEMCNLNHAHSLVAMTGNDTANLEIALGARARNAELPAVMRVQDPTFARLIEHQFNLDSTYSPSELSAPGFAGLARFPGTRGRIGYGKETYNVGERQQGEVPQPPPAKNCIPLAVWRRGELRLIDDFSLMEPYDRLLFLVPLSQFRTKPKAPASPEMETAAAV
ncbi:MAG: NAD-binding protein [Candidatus Eremiobacteraeota bacterium]|nr:NAD-binding protein [Candidatus Eremiobacteraeota bacterium]MBV8355131.1 NAD-binding protein [Candidatus Eremiobacteraeota bacterium]